MTEYIATLLACMDSVTFLEVLGTVSLTALNLSPLLSKDRHFKHYLSYSIKCFINWRFGDSHIYKDILCNMLAGMFRSHDLPVFY